MARRWQKPKPSKLQRDVARGQMLLLPALDPDAAPWEIDDAESPPTQAASTLKRGWKPPPPPKPNDKIPF